MPIRVLWATLAALLAACGGGGQMAGPPEPAPGGAATTVSGELTVFAAASLTDAFEEIGRRFEEAHPGVRVTFNVASSSTLATQITQGAPADVFASADQAQMDAVDDADLVAGERTTFASNSLQIAVEPGNPRGIESLEDLTRDDVTVVLAAEEVPAGEYAHEALDAGGFEVSPASLETDVRAALSRVALGEADAGVVYSSDIVAAGDDVEGVDIPADRNVTASYPIATLTDTPNPDAAREFVGYVTSADGRQVLDALGFSPPS